MFTGGTRLNEAQAASELSYPQIVLFRLRRTRPAACGFAYRRDGGNVDAAPVAISPATSDIATDSRTRMSNGFAATAGTHDNRITVRNSTS
jgi:hypothetical protein